MTNRAVLLQLRNQIEATPWVMRHNLSIGIACPFRVVWLYPIQRGLDPECWRFRGAGAGMLATDFPVASYLSRGVRSEFEASITNGAQCNFDAATFSAEWQPRARRFGPITMIAKENPALVTAFILRGNTDYEKLHGIIYQPSPGLDGYEQSLSPSAA